jgi:MFS superfamily sulfate permease-like transporter
MPQVTIMVACIYLVLAVFRLGFLCNLLSRPIISAFLTAGAMTISLSQARPPLDLLTFMHAPMLQVPASPACLPARCPPVPACGR